MPRTSMNQLSLAVFLLFCCGAGVVSAGARCGGDSSGLVRSFTNGVSQVPLNSTEIILLEHILSDTGVMGVVSHVWITGTKDVDMALVRFYVDGDPIPDIEVNAAMAVGVGFSDETAPWGNTWNSKAANTGGWSFKYRVPFLKSIRVTVALPASPPPPTDAIVWAIARGNENLPISIGGYQLPMSAQLQVFTVENVTVQPLDFIDFFNVDSTFSGLVFMHFLMASSSTPSYLEGCYRLYSPPSDPFPGQLLSTGTEDYFDSAFYFDAGTFRLPNSGLTHRVSSDSVYEISAYRMHDTDVLSFMGGARMQWRNSEVFDPNTGQKCLTLQGDVHGSLNPVTVSAYTWVYVWRNEAQTEAEAAL